MLSDVAIKFSWSGQKRPNVAIQKMKFQDKKISTILIGKIAILIALNWSLTFRLMEFKLLKHRLNGSEIVSCNQVSIIYKIRIMSRAYTWEIV